MSWLYVGFDSFEIHRLQHTSSYVLSHQLSLAGSVRAVYGTWIAQGNVMAGICLGHVTLEEVQRCSGPCASGNTEGSSE